MIEKQPERVEPVRFLKAVHMGMARFIAVPFIHLKNIQTAYGCTVPVEMRIIIIIAVANRNGVNAVLLDKRL